MADSKPLTALQPFLILAKSATGRAACDLVVQATSSPGCFVFSELLECPNIQALASSSDSSQYFHLLKLFAYGSFMDYKANLATFPKLNVKQLEKLKQLSLITLASRGTEYLTYPSLLRELDLPNIRLLEDLVISATYANLITAKLDTASRFVDVTSTAGRDVAPEKIPRMVEVLRMWCEQCDDVLADIDEQMKAIVRDALLKKKETEDYEGLLKEKKDGLKGDEKPAPATSQGKGKRVISEGADDGRYEADEMDVDEPASHGHVETEHARFGANASRRRARGRVGNKRR